MNQPIYRLALTMLVAGAIFTGCDSAAKKEETAKTEVQDAKQDLKVAQKEANAEAQQKADNEDWAVFKAENELKIKDNEVRIADLKIKLKKPGKVLDPLYTQRIEDLNKRNKALQTKIDNYVPGQTDWQKFKAEYNHDMEELGHALKDFTVKNKK